MISQKDPIHFLGQMKLGDLDSDTAKTEVEQFMEKFQSFGGGIENSRSVLLKILDDGQFQLSAEHVPLSNKDALHFNIDVFQNVFGSKLAALNLFRCNKSFGKFGDGKSEISHNTQTGLMAPDIAQETSAAWSRSRI